MFFNNLFFPKLCLSCGYLGSYICEGCQKKIIYREKQACLYCDKSSHLGLTHPACKRKGGVDGFMAFFRYNPTLKKYIVQIKYRLVSEALEDVLISIKPETLSMVNAYIQLREEMVIQPIPLHINREKARGFNQADIIARHLSRIFQLSVSRILQRVKDTPAQAQLHDNKKRYHNMLGAFTLKEGIITLPKHILLIDDVVTTGSTMKEAAKTLKKHGAQTVFILALAKG